MNATADYLATPQTAASAKRGDLAKLLDGIEPRQTAEFTVNGKARHARAVSVTRASDGALDVYFGDWMSNPFRPDLLTFDVACLQPSRRYKSAAGAARAVAKWLGGDR